MLVAASHSGAGKTTVVATLLRALGNRGLSVQAFKIGPDFIDTAYHSQATGRPAINLDLWMMGADAIQQSFSTFSAGADVSVIESMGALFDGADGTATGSAADLAKLLGVPVVVVLDVWGMTRTTGATIDGLRNFDPDLEVAGVILNRVGSPTQTSLILNSLAPEVRRLVLGAIPYGSSLDIPERHLGLLTVEENPGSKTDRDDAHRVAADALDIDRLLDVAGQSANISAPPEPRTTKQGQTVVGRRVDRRARLAIARDPAFCVYYEENLIALRYGERRRELHPRTFRVEPQRPPALSPRGSCCAQPAGVASRTGGTMPYSRAESLHHPCWPHLGLRHHARCVPIQLRPTLLCRRCSQLLRVLRSRVRSSTCDGSW